MPARRRWRSIATVTRCISSPRPATAHTGHGLLGSWLTEAAAARVPVRITAAALARYPTAVSWRMDGVTYAAHAASGVALAGTSTATPWEPALAEMMIHSGRAVMEERILPLLLQDLS
ncbi:DUF2399 domain-containing protein [Dactylosporangium sp. NPDC051484]|uniref:DUF2399 domain-containing protein n=1 Tax=Dactylosporangium sp. NPDC051484 TaxID=3154942 RepID=UPI0034501CF4